MSQEEGNQQLIEDKEEFFKQQVFVVILTKQSLEEVQVLHFDIGKEIYFADRFGDLAVRYYDENITKYIFLHARYIDEPEDIQVTEGLSMDINYLKKFYVSFLRIHNQFKQNGASQIEKVIIFTNASGISINGLSAEKVDKMTGSKGIDLIFETNERAETYKFNVEKLKGNKIWSELKELSHFDDLVNALIKCNAGTEKSTDDKEVLGYYQTALIRDDVIIVTEKKGERKAKFQDNFITGKNLGDSAKALRNEMRKKVGAIKKTEWEVSHSFGKTLDDLVYELVNFITHTEERMDFKKDIFSCFKTLLIDEEVIKMPDEENEEGGQHMGKFPEKGKTKRATEILTKIKKQVKTLFEKRKDKLGEDYTSNKDQYINNKMKEATWAVFNTDSEEIITLPSSNICNEDSIENFFNCLEVKVNQPTELELSELITKKDVGQSTIETEGIRGKFLKYSSSDRSYLTFLIRKCMQEWKDDKKRHENWILSSEKANFIERMNEYFSSSDAILRTIQYKDDKNGRIKRYNIKFKEQVPELDYFLKQGNEQILCIVTQSTLLTAIKIVPDLEELQNCGYIFVNLKHLLEENSGLEQAFNSDEYNLLLVDCSFNSDDDDDHGHFKQLCEIMKRSKNKKMSKKIILVTPEGNALVEKFIGILKTESLINIEEKENFIEVKDTKIEPKDVEDISTIVNEEITFQGKKLKFKSLSNDEDGNPDIETLVNEIMDIPTLAHIVSGVPLSIGPEVPSLGEIKDYYINRTLYCHIVFRPDIIDAIRDSDNRLRDELFVISGSGYDLRFDRTINNKVYLVDNHRAAKQKLVELKRNHPSYNIHWLENTGDLREPVLIWMYTLGTIAPLVWYKVEDKRK